MEAKSISFWGFKCFLQNIINIEKKIEVRNNTLRMHYKKLNFLVDILKLQKSRHCLIYCSDMKANLSSTREGWEYGEGGWERFSFFFLFFFNL